MHHRTYWARLAIGAAAVAASALACDSVLDIQDPKMRPGDAGASGDPATGATSNGGTSGGEAGSAPQGGAGEGGGTSSLLGGAGAGGEAGTPAMKDCVANAVQCGGGEQKTPQICDENGNWLTNTAQADGDCPVLCNAGKCTECEDGTKRCTVCADDAADCNANQPQTCKAGAWKDDAKACANYCDAGSCKTPTSCGTEFAVLNTCKDGISCCAANLVPGGTFFRSYDGTEDFGEQIYEATVSPFVLDKFEVTVGRMRPFVAIFDGVHHTNGAGKSPHITDDTGWNENYMLPANQAELIAQLECGNGKHTWSDSNASNELPINCVPFNVAYAFCIWDGGRLPTEAEWNFAAVGGAEQRVYPWATGEPDPTYANYATTAPANVGTSPLGNGRWGQSDLMGNLGEWVLDYNHDYPSPCSDCLITTASTDRVVRGGSYLNSILTFLSPSYRAYAEATDATPTRGFRCAYDLE